ncbi:MAG: nitrate reductase subunit alpha [Candidatus Paceibacterota bacterium]|jgi:nitrate reductase alpha subunit|nr:nitrate reductase subunit alpha [Candidatus Paceibacterota bacterium]
MKRTLDKLSRLFGKTSNEHEVVTEESRDWERLYRDRLGVQKTVRSTHGVNCTGSCSWEIQVKNGLVIGEVQKTDYPRTRPGLPNHEPRGCPRGASASWYLYSAARLKHPLARGALVRIWREARKTLDPVSAWASIVEDPEKTKSYKTKRGMGGFVRLTWDEAMEIIAAANIYTIKKYGPDRVVGFSPIPAMSMASYSGGTRYLSLIGGANLSFYDWYCDLPPSSPQVWGEQTDVPESADWYNSKYILVWGSNVPQTRTPDAHFLSESRYNGTKSVVVSSDYSEAVKFADLWMHPKQGHDAALAMAMGHVILNEYHSKNRSLYFSEYCKAYTDMPLLVALEEKDGTFQAGRFLRASDFDQTMKEEKSEWKTVLINERTGNIAVPNGSIGFRWDESGKWNLLSEEITPRLSLLGTEDETVKVSMPYFGGDESENILLRSVPVKKFFLNGKEVLAATVYDLLLANYGVSRDPDVTEESYNEVAPYTPAWAEKHCGVSKELIIKVAREFAENADKTLGRSMIILGAAINHWYHSDMTYRGIMNMLMMCGCVGQSGGGWAHYVGQEKLRPQTGWAPLAFATDWSRPPRQMNGTSFFYTHSDQWRFEKLKVSEILSPLADTSLGNSHLYDWNTRAIRMGWLPTLPALDVNSLEIAKKADRAGISPSEYVVSGLKDGTIRFACEDPDKEENYPRNLFLWRSNLLGSSGKGHEYLLKYLLGTQSAVLGNESKDMKPTDSEWREDPPEGKLDLFVVLDFRKSTSVLYADIALPSATWYEKDDMNTSDMHPFIHPLQAAVDPLFESKTDWEIFRSVAKKFAELTEGNLGVEKDVVLTPLLHDSPGELGQPFGEVKDWKKGECEPVPGKTMPNITVVERDYPNTYKKFTSVGPLLSKLGNGGKGISWNTEKEVDGLKAINGCVEEEGVSKGMPKIESAVQACEMILEFAPETNGAVAVRSWEALEKITGLSLADLAKPREADKIRFKDIVVQPRKIISSPIWSGIESEEVCYTAFWTNVHKRIPWRTLTGRQQFYQDHAWMIAFGEGFAVYKPPIDTKTIESVLGFSKNGNKEIVLNWITPHQKWGIHSNFSDNLRMLTLSRGGPNAWISEDDAKEAGIVDNDWIEIWNENGTLAVRAVLSQRVPRGMILMYHAQEKNVNMPQAEMSGKRGGIHNSVTRTVVKPTHMIGGYAQLSYGFNYYGTVGSNRDEFVIVRKMKQDVKW